MEVATVNYRHIPLFCDISFLGHDCPAACTIATSADASSTASKCRPPSPRSPATRLARGTRGANSGLVAAGLPGACACRRLACMGRGLEGRPGCLIRARIVLPVLTIVRRGICIAGWRNLLTSAWHGGRRHSGLWGSSSSAWDRTGLSGTGTGPGMFPRR